LHLPAKEASPKSSLVTASAADGGTSFVEIPSKRLIELAEGIDVRVFRKGPASETWPFEGVLELCRRRWKNVSDARRRGAEWSRALTLLSATSSPHGHETTIAKTEVLKSSHAEDRISRRRL
jgi:hypothetical protein